MRAQWLLQRFLYVIGMIIAVRFLSLVAFDYAFASQPVSMSPQEPDRSTVAVNRAKPTPTARNVFQQEAYDVILHNATRCPLTFRPTSLLFRNAVWHMFQNGSQEIHVYSAYFDDRPAVGVLPFLRLLAVATPTKAPLYCQLWYEGLENPVVVELEVKASGRGDKIRGIKYGQYQFTCPLQYTYPVPTHVSVSTSPCGDTTILLPVQVPVRGLWKHEFGVCVAIAFGELPWHQLIEWIELTRMQGVAEINVYNGSMSESMRPLFQYYEQQGIIRLHQMPPPQYDYSKWGTKLASPASLNDCMLRHMYRYKYIVVVDFDELIMPRKDRNYHDMLARIDSEMNLPEAWPSYTFRNLYFFSDLSPAAGPLYNSMLRYRKRVSKPSNYLFAPKSFIDPRRCESLFNHYCYIRFKNLPAKWTIDVPTDTAMSHHYRKCGFKEAECNTMIKESVQDDDILKYNATLNKQMLKVFSDLKYNPN